MFDNVRVFCTFDDLRATWDTQEYVEDYLTPCFVSRDVARDNWDRLWWATDLPNAALLERFFLYNPCQRFFWLAHRSIG